MEQWAQSAAGLNYSASAKILVHNLTTFLIKHQKTNSSLWNNLNDPDHQHSWWKMVENRRLSYAVTCILIVLYSLVIAVGVVGNSMVIWAVIRQPTMRTLRNTFIINLAVSDLLLCLVTMPLTLLEIITKYWPLGDSVIGCKMAGGLQAVSIFVSTMSITAISLDRYQLIVYPTRDYLKRIGAVAALLCIWMVAFLMATPIFLFRSLDHHTIWPPGQTSSVAGLDSVDYCYENWPVAHGRALYSAGTIIFQYAAPILIISIVHLKICRRLRLRQAMLTTMGKDSRKKATEKRRLRRLNTLLVIIASVFAVCWMPLNIYNLVLDLCNVFQRPEDQQKMLIIYAVCHLCSMSSACTNPFLYGWFNDNFRQEFGDIAAPMIRCCSRYYPSVMAHRSSNASSVPKRRSMVEGDSNKPETSGGNEVEVGVNIQMIECSHCSPSHITATTNLQMTSIHLHCEVTTDDVSNGIFSQHQVEASSSM